MGWGVNGNSREQWPIHRIRCGQHQLQTFLVLLEIRALKAHHAIGASSRRQLLLGEAELPNGGWSARTFFVFPSSVLFLLPLPLAFASSTCGDRISTQ